MHDNIRLERVSSLTNTQVANTHTGTHTCTHVRIHTNTRTKTHMQTHRHAHIHTHTHVLQSWWKTRRAIWWTLAPGRPEEEKKLLFDRCV